MKTPRGVAPPDGDRGGIVRSEPRSPDAKEMTLKGRLKRRLFRIMGRLASAMPRAQSPVPSVGAIRHVMVMEIGGVGDMLLTFPLLEAIGRSFPEARRYTLTNQTSEVFGLMPKQVPTFDHLRLDPSLSYLGKLRQIRRLRRRLPAIDLLVVPARGNGAWEVALLARTMGARYRLGFDIGGCAMFYTHRAPFVPTAWIAQQNLALLEKIGVHSDWPSVRIEVEDEARQTITTWLRENGLNDRRLVALQVWATHLPEFKEWPLPAVQAFLRSAATRLNAHVLILGSRSDHPKAASLLNPGGYPRVHNLCGLFPLPETAALLGHCSLLIGIDSLLLHLACALDLPVLGLFGATAPEQIMEPGPRRRALALPLPCSPCYVHQAFFDYRCQPGDFRCMRDLAPERVLEHAVELLARSPPAPGHAS